VSCGWDVLEAVTERGLPVRGVFSRARARKWMRQDSLYRGAAAAVLLGHLLPDLMAKLGNTFDEEPRADAPTVASEQHERLRNAIADFYPLQHRNLPASFLAEFTVLEQGQPRPEVASGEEQGSEFSRALLRGEDPSGDPELVAIQRRWARDYFIDMATIQVLRIVLFSDYAKIDRRVVNIVKPGARRVSETRAKLLAAWIDGTSGYRQYALLDSADARPETTRLTPRAELH
jgi:hypothetical protein